MATPAVPAWTLVGKDEHGNPAFNAVYDSGARTGDAGYALVHPARAGIARPTEVGSLGGAYMLGLTSGTINAGLGANSIIYSFRWAPTVTTFQALIKRISLSMASLGTGFTAGTGLFNLIPCRAFTANDTGGTAITPSATTPSKYRTSFPISAVANVQIVNNAAIAAGTRVVDTNPAGTLAFGVTTATNTVMLATTDILRRDQGAADWPYILANNEGFEIQATVPATGTWQAQVFVDWIEVPVF